MAKKKAAGKPKPVELTPEQFKQLGERMLKGGGNIFTVARMMFKVDGGDELFDGVKKHAGACKCEMCDQWKPQDEMEPGTENDVCEECMSDEEEYE